MSKAGFSIVTPSGGVSVAKDGAKHTILQCKAPTNQLTTLKGFRISCQGVTPTDPPMQFRLLRQTAATGTSGGTVTPTNTDANNVTIQSTATYGYTAEPTAGAVLDEGFVNTVTSVGIIYTLSKEYVILAGGTIGIEMTNSASASAPIVVEAYMDLEE